jgi:SAM-dependent methyltransferase
VSSEDPGLPPAIDTSRPHPARVYDYFLDGKDHYPADRKAGEQVLEAVPTAKAMARANRAFLQRAVRFLARAGIRQFLDIGTGLPTRGSVHQAAHEITPDADIVYVDNDPVVLAHSRALLAGDYAVVVQGDLRRPDSILGDAAVAKTIDFDRPVAVPLVAILHFLSYQDRPEEVVGRFVEAMAPGSYLVISHATADFNPQAAAQAARAYEHATSPIVLRNHAEVARLFCGLPMIPPGLVQLPDWRPEPSAKESLEVWAYGGVGQRR